ncbi:MAG: RHS repeat-associated core domain-containing protein, partial [Desulfobacteraceae bacterium]|nr:RHS repeat-associated core domain-containing protein [Desulfobacteraceae bacterium]
NYYIYTPFGKTLLADEAVSNDFEFVGQFGVRNMGNDLTYMRNRFYMPSMGRFYSEDPIGLAGGDVSFYRYVQNDPVNWIDPEGLEMGYPDTISDASVSAAKNGFSELNGTLEQRQKYYQPQIRNTVKAGASQMNAIIQMPFPAGSPVISKFMYDHWKKSNPDGNYIEFYLDSLKTPYSDQCQN